jgi:thiol-disulfide isomerase/thioredoxin
MAGVMLAAVAISACGGGSAKTADSGPTSDSSAAGQGGTTGGGTATRGTAGESPTPGSGSGGSVNPNDLGMLGPDRPEIGKKAPDFALVDARTGEVHRLSDYFGQPIVLNWYASWCAPCEREFPEFKTASDALDGQVTFIGLDYKEDAGKALKLPDKYGTTYAALLDTKGEVGDRYRLQGPPLTYFLDKDGIIRAIRAGELLPAQLVENLAKVNVAYAAP